jgi:DNA-binding transcriptional regulator YdaS (Cro superfamily)
MELRDYLKMLTASEKKDFADRCGTTIGYIRKNISTDGRFGLLLCVAMERASDGAVSCEELRPDINWSYLRDTSPPATVPPGLPEKQS